MNINEMTQAIRGEIIGTEAIAADKTGRRPAIQGTVRDETKNTLTIETENKELKRIIKNENQITLINRGARCELDGSAICQRSEDRLKMKVEQ
ncbi:MAG: ribonuclease P protein subunit [Nanoarchaeota archaeon]